LADFELRGTIDGQPITIGQPVSSNITSGNLQVLSVANGEVRTDLDLRWTGALSEGGVMNLAQGSLYVPAGQPGGDRFYCFAGGDFGPVPAAEQPSAEGKLFEFRLRQLSAGADCSGGQVAGDLKGCLFRTNTLLP